MTVTIYHNPACGTSRNVLAYIREAGYEPKIVEYLKCPPDRKTLKDLLKRMGKRPRDILRKRGTPYEALNLDNPALTDEQILDAIETHPILIERPIVDAGDKVALCRPAETVKSLVGCGPEGSQNRAQKKPGA
jgi:arsenate reductase